MTTQTALRVGIIGCGRLAWSLAPALHRAGYALVAVAGREATASRALAGAVGPAVEATTAPQRVLDEAQLIFVTVSDDAIAPVVTPLRWGRGHLAVHCSGAVGLAALAPVVDAGGDAGCLHPLQSFPERRADPDRFRGIHCGVEGVEPLGGLLERVATDLGAHAFRLEGVDRAAYHAAAVMVSNHVVALTAAAQRVWQRAGLPAATAREALAPLLLAAAGNVAYLETGAALGGALTGPLARGDVTTIAAHLEALATLPELRELYRLLSRELLAIAPHLDPEARQQIEQTLARPS